MTDLEFLLPRDSNRTPDNLLNQLANAKFTLPFSDAAVDFVGKLSQTMLIDHDYRQYPEMIALAHWFRPAHLLQMKQDFLDRSALTGNVFVARGVAFHLAPSNVDSIFAYSWLLSVLCGNANVVRVSRKRTPQILKLCGTANALLAQKKYQDLANCNVILCYEHDDAVTAAISDRCHLRIVWGGNATTRHIRSIPLPPLSTELVFADRFSIAVFNSNAVEILDDSPLRQLAFHFFNDAFWFNQQACSSPRAVIWIGEPESSARAQAKFWEAFSDHVREKNPENLPAQVMDRTTLMFRYAYEHEHIKCFTRQGDIPVRVLLNRITESDRECHDGNGLFIELYRDNLLDIAALIRSVDQTITYFGFEKREWIPMLTNVPPHAADRIVPVGRALEFSPIWDGQDFFRSFTREILLQ